jgi:hypothetical protein
MHEVGLAREGIQTHTDRPFHLQPRLTFYGHVLYEKLLEALPDRKEEILRFLENSKAETYVKNGQRLFTKEIWDRCYGLDVVQASSTLTAAMVSGIEDPSGLPSELSSAHVAACVLSP